MIFGLRRSRAGGSKRIMRCCAFITVDFNWTFVFKCGTTSIGGDARSGRPKSVTTSNAVPTLNEDFSRVLKLKYNTNAHVKCL